DHAAVRVPGTWLRPERDHGQPGRRDRRGRLPGGLARVVSLHLAALQASTAPPRRNRATQGLDRTSRQGAFSMKGTLIMKRTLSMKRLFIPGAALAAGAVLAACGSGGHSAASPT